MDRTKRTTLLTVLFSFTALAAAEQNGKDPVANFCRRHKHQTCVIDSKLYIDGGLVYYGNGVAHKDVAVANTWLLWEDLNNTGYDFPTQRKDLEKSSEVPTVSGGALWPDHANKLFYLFAGEYTEGSAKAFDHLWFFDTIYNTWNKTVSDDSHQDILWPAYGASTVTDEGVAYYYGGLMMENSDPRWKGDPFMLNSLIFFDTKTNKWSNSTGPTPRAEGNMHYIPASQRGMLIYIGGVESDNGNVSYTRMDDIHLFDIANSRWYSQRASGDVPQARRGFCPEILWAEDYSSYNFYIYGGIAANGSALGDGHILSLPSFEWITWFPIPDRTYYANGKAWSSCNIFQNPQMIVMGGEMLNPNSTQSCDSPNTGGQHGLLLGQEGNDLNAQWYGLIPNVSSYRVPSNITEIIGGRENGNATVTKPFIWVTSDLSIYFKTSYLAQAPAPTRVIPTSSPPPYPTTSPTPPKHSITGAIAGGAAAGVTALISAIVIALCLCRRHRRKQAATQATSQNEQPEYKPSREDHDKYLTSPTIASYPSPYVHSAQLTPHTSSTPLSWSKGHSPESHYQGTPSTAVSGWTDWQQGQQVYLAVPLEQLQGRKCGHAGETSAELPGSEGVVSELPAGSSVVGRAS